MTTSTPALRLLIVEDEFITLDSLRAALDSMGYNVVGDAMTVEEAKDILAKTTVDMVILDINLRGEHQGIELGRYINKHYGVPFIYLTAYDDPATIQLAADTAPFGYLVKPCTPAAIHAALKVAVARTRAAEPEASLFLKDNNNFFRVNATDILYVEAFRNYLEIHVAAEKRVVRSTLKGLEEKLPEGMFFQPHRSFLVNTAKVTAYRDGELHLGAARVPVSKRGHQVVSKFFASKYRP